MYLHGRYAPLAWQADDPRRSRRYALGMAKKDDRPKQKTKPVKGKPVEIPIPTKRDVLRDLRAVAKPEKPPAKH
jgi:hypothetical protein